MGEIGHSESFCANLVVKVWKSCKKAKIGHSKSFCATSVGKERKSGKKGKIGHKWLMDQMCSKHKIQCFSHKFQKISELWNFENFQTSENFQKIFFV